ncbi:TetR family transcriptional regulator [Amycolatopsis minnesotensis]|uniref:TetR family transcriptional regulator n=1 Tax=Amycolatopsis minnesotensis TaxID=337894 RepID=A0ABP5CRS4_9PSEU
MLAAAVEVLGADGTRALTYQAVDTEAGVPAGTTSNCFRTRDALVRGVLAHLVELDRADWDRFTRIPPADADALASALAGLARHAAGPGRARTRARFALFLEAAARPELTDLLAAGREAVLDWGEQWLAPLAPTAPRELYRRLIGHLDGVVLHQLTFPADPFDPAPGFRALVRESTMD